MLPGRRSVAVTQRQKWSGLRFVGFIYGIACSGCAVQSLLTAEKDPGKFPLSHASALEGAERLQLAYYSCK